MRSSGVTVISWLCLQDFVTGLSVSLYGNREEKIKWAFQLYDLDGDGCITREVRPIVYDRSFFALL